MTDLDARALRAAQFQQPAGLGRRLGEWLLDEHMPARREGCRGQVEMREGWGHHIHRTTGVDELFDTMEGMRAELAPDRLHLRRVGVVEPGQVPVGQFLQLLDVDAAQMAGPQDPDASECGGHGRQK